MTELKPIEIKYTTAKDFPIHHRFSGELLSLKCNTFVKLCEQVVEHERAKLKCMEAVKDAEIAMLKAALKDERDVKDTYAKMYENSQVVVRTYENHVNLLGKLKHIRLIQQSNAEVFNPLIVENLHEQHTTIQVLQGYLKTIYELI